MRITDEQHQKAKEYVITRSALVELERWESCPEKWFRHYVLKEGSYPSNEYMLRGNYVDYHVLGSNAYSTEVPELPLLKNGDRSANHKRLDLQVEWLRDALFNKESENWLGLTDIKLQGELKVSDLYVEGQTVSGMFDILGRWEKHPFDETFNGKMAVIDLKVSMDMYKTSDPYNYLHANIMNQIQAAHYVNMAEAIHKEEFDFFYLVADYSTKTRRALVHVSKELIEAAEAEDRFVAAFDTLQHYLSEGVIPAIGEHNECSTCMVTDCPAKLINPIDEGFSPGDENIGDDGSLFYIDDEAIKNDV